MTAPTPLSRTELAWWLCCALAGVLLAGWLAHVPLEAVEHIQDEVLYRLQARALAQGGLTWDSPSPLASAPYHFVVDHAGRRVGVFPWGWPAVLALGVLLRAPLWVNPLLHGVTVLLGGRLARDVAGKEGGRLATALLALSPALLLLAGSRMSHTLVGALVLAALLAATRARWLWVGACLGLLVLTRQLDSVALALVLAPVVLRGGARAVALSAVIPALAVGVTAALNLHITGSLEFPQTWYFENSPPPTAEDHWRYAPGCNRLGLGMEVGCFPTFGGRGHTLEKAVMSLGRNMNAAGRLWLGVTPLLVLPLAAAFNPKAQRLLSQGKALWAAVALGYTLYWVAGLAYGARFHHAAAALWVTLGAVGAVALLDRWPRLPRWSVALLVLPMVGRLVVSVQELPGYWGVDGRFSQLESRWEGPEGALLLVAYDADIRRRVRYSQTLGDELGVSPALARGGWIGRAGPLVYREYQPELVDATRAALGDPPTWVYVMHAAAGDDELLPWESLEHGPQLLELPLPVSPVLMPPAKARAKP